MQSDPIRSFEMFFLIWSSNLIEICSTSWDVCPWLIYYSWKQQEYRQYCRFTHRRPTPSGIWGIIRWLAFRSPYTTASTSNDFCVRFSTESANGVRSDMSIFPLMPIARFCFNASTNERTAHGNERGMRSRSVPSDRWMPLREYSDLDQMRRHSDDSASGFCQTRVEKLNEVRFSDPFDAHQQWAFAVDNCHSSLSHSALTKLHWLHTVFVDLRSCHAWSVEQNLPSSSPTKFITEFSYLATVISYRCGFFFWGLVCSC